MTKKLGVSIVAYLYMTLSASVTLASEPPTPSVAETIEYINRKLAENTTPSGPGGVCSPKYTVSVENSTRDIRIVQNYWSREHACHSDSDVYPIFGIDAAVDEDTIEVRDPRYITPSERTGAVLGNDIVKLECPVSCGRKYEYFFRFNPTDPETLTRFGRALRHLVILLKEQNVPPPDPFSK